MQFGPSWVGWLDKAGLPVTGFREGSWGPPLTFPRAVLIFGISPVIGFKTLNQLASGILRVHGGEPSKPSKPSVFVLLVFFRRICSFCSRTVKTVKTAKTVKPASLVPSVFEESSRRTLGNRQNRQFFKKGPPIGSKEHSLTHGLLTHGLPPPDGGICKGSHRRTQH